MMKKIFHLFGLLLFLTLFLNACASQKGVAQNNDALYKPAVNVGKGKTPGGQEDLTSVMLKKLAASNNNLVANGDVSSRELSTVDKAKARATYGPKISGFTNATMNFNYMPGALYEVYCAPLSVTDIQLKRGERIIAVAAGDTLRWQVSKTYSGSQNERREHILIKPTDTDLTNTLVITTDQRTYHLLLHATAKTYMPLVSWRYADDDMIENLTTDKSGIAAEDQYAGFAQGLDVNHLDFNYRVKLASGQKPEWMPNLVFNDGNKTYIRLPTKIQEAPTLFIGSSGSSQIINYRVVGNYYVVDSLFPRAQLRQNQIVVQIEYTRK